MMNMMHAEGRVDVFSFVSRIRNQRCQLVQTDVRLGSVKRTRIFFFSFSPSCIISENSFSHACTPADAVLIYLSSFAGALPVRWHRVGRFLTGTPPTQTPQHAHTHGQSGARRGIQSNKTYIEPVFLSFFLSLYIFRLSWIWSFFKVHSLVFNGRHSMLSRPYVMLSYLYFLLLQKLTNVRIMKENMRTGNLSANMRKNRVLQIIPCKEMILHCCHSDSSPNLLSE